jgi:hypothetical protein
VIVGLALGLNRAPRLAALIFLPVDLAVAVDLDHKDLREGVDDRDADPVESARDLIGALVELASGVKHRHHDLERRFAAVAGMDLGAAHRVDRDAGAVVEDRHRVAGMDDHIDGGAAAGEDLIDRVIHRLIDQVVEARGTRRPDIHRGSLAHRLKTLEDLYL